MGKELLRSQAARAPSHGDPCFLCSELFHRRVILTTASLSHPTTTGEHCVSLLAVEPAFVPRREKRAKPVGPKPDLCLLCSVPPRDRRHLCVSHQALPYASRCRCHPPRARTTA